MKQRWVISSPKVNMVLSLLRVVFFPLLLTRAQQSVGNTSDLGAFAIVAAFAFTNGYVGTLAMMTGPQLVRVAERELAGTVMAFTLMVGLNSGALVGGAINDIMFAGGGGDTCVVS